MARYLALEAIVLSSESRFINAGEEFSTDILPPAPCWQPLDDDARAAVELLDAADNPLAEPVADAPVDTKTAKPNT